MVKLVNRLVWRLVDKWVDTADAILKAFEESAQREKAEQCPDEVEQMRLF